MLIIHFFLINSLKELNQDYDLIHFENYLSGVSKVEASHNAFYHEYGLNLPIFINLKPIDVQERDSISVMQHLKSCLCQTRFYCYLKKIVHLDFGHLRYQSDQQVASYALKHLGFSCLILVPIMLLTFVTAQLLGLLMALKEGSILDKILTAFFTALYAIPVYIMSPLLIEKIGLPFHLPLGGVQKHISIGLFLSQLILPYLAISYGALAIYTRMSRSLFINLMSQDHLLVAKAKGLSFYRIIFVHTLRQSLVTSVPLFLGSFHFFISTQMIIENLFEINGFGRMFYQAILNQDYPLLIFSVLLLSALTQLTQFAADYMHYQFEPRIKYNVDQRIFA